MKNLILLHGALGEASQMEALKTVLENKFKVYIPEFDGHGKKSNSTNSLDIDAMSDELNSFIENELLINPIVFGYSMGGYVALNHALKYPHKIVKIITLATKFEWNPESSAKESQLLNPDQMELQIPAFCEILKQRHGNDWKQLVIKTAEMMLQLGQNPVLTTSNLNRVTIPVLVCLGEKDKMVSLEESQKAVASLKQARLQILPDTPHPFERVNMNQLATIITQFLADSNE